MRVLIFSANIGEGHDAPARALRDAIVLREPAANVSIVDSLAVSGPTVRVLVRRGSEVILGRFGWLFDVQYWLIARFRPTRAFFAWLGTVLARRRLLGVVAQERADVVVSTYPGATHVLGEMRRRGRLSAPLVSAITDLAALRYWAHPGCDLHLVIHPESSAEVRQIAGDGTRIEHVRGLVSPAFEEPRDVASARAALGLPGSGPVVAVSGGGWGVGDLEGAVRRALQVADDALVVALCGRNDALRARLDASYAHESRVLVLGFTDRMGDVLAAADVLIHSTAGLTALEAMIRGARVISYGWGAGHLRLNNRAYVRFGLVDVVTAVDRLVPAIRTALASPRRPDLGYGSLPSAADLVLELARG